MWSKYMHWSLCFEFITFILLPYTTWNVYHGTNHVLDKYCISHFAVKGLYRFRPNFIQYIPNQFLHVGLAKILNGNKNSLWSRKSLERGFLHQAPEHQFLACPLNFTTEIRLIVYYSVCMTSVTCISALKDTWCTWIIVINKTR